MSAAHGQLMNESPSTREERGDVAPESRENEDGQSTFWVWFALGVLMFCWIAEATMCAERGF
jgi:hypothetical protein